MSYVEVVPETLSTKTSDAPRYQYSLDFDYSSRTKTSIVINYRVWGRIYGNGTYDATNAMVAWPYANGKYPSGGVTLRATGTKWTKDHGWYSKTGSFTISNLSMSTTSISTALEVTKTGGQTNGTLSKKAGKNFSIPAWTSYTITYKANGGSGAPAAGKKWKDEAYTVSSTKPTRTGYDFVNWKINTGYTVKAGGTITASSNANYTLTAQWQAHTYTIVYNKNASDATGTTSSSTHTYDVAKALTANGFARTGYKFLGWATSASSTTVEYTDKKSVTNLKSADGATLNLYAVWEELTYAINIYSNGGTFNNDKTSLNKTKRYTQALVLDKPTRTHYTFLGWGTSASSTTVALKPNENYNQNKANNFYAIWQEDDVYLSLYGYSDDTTYTEIYKNYKVYKNETTTITLNDIQNVYKFLGWSSSKLDVLPFADESIYSKNINVTQNSTFYGVYKDITPTLFKVTSTDVVRASEVADFDTYVNSPDTFAQIDQDGSGHKVFGYVELSGEYLNNLNIANENISISPSLTNSLFKTFNKQYNKLFFWIQADDLSFTTKYIVSFDCKDNLGKDVKFSVSIPYKHPIIDIYKQNDTDYDYDAGFNGEFRIKINNHDSPIGYQYRGTKDLTNLVSGSSARVVAVSDEQITKGVWYISCDFYVHSMDTGAIWCSVATSIYEDGGSSADRVTYAESTHLARNPTNGNNMYVNASCIAVIEQPRYLVLWGNQTGTAGKSGQFRFGATRIL